MKKSNIELIFCGGIFSNFLNTSTKKKSKV